jgi:hypothetical protein
MHQPKEEKSREIRLKLIFGPDAGKEYVMEPKHKLALHWK